MAQDQNSSLYVQRSAQNYTTTQSKQIFHQASVTFLDLPIQNGDSSALVLPSSHSIGHSEIHTLWALHDVFWPTTSIHGLHDSTNPTSSVNNANWEQKLERRLFSLGERIFAPDSKYVRYKQRKTVYFI